MIVEENLTWEDNETYSNSNKFENRSGLKREEYIEIGFRINRKVKLNEEKNERDLKRMTMIVSVITRSSLNVQVVIQIERTNDPQCTTVDGLFFCFNFKSSSKI